MLTCATAAVLIFTAASLARGARPAADKAELESKPVVLERFGVSFRGPGGWFTPDRETMIENIRKLDSSKEDVAAILATLRRSIPLATYLKHDPRGHAGMIPTINVIGRPNPHTTFEVFRDAIAAQSHSIGSTLWNYQVTTPAAERDLEGRRVVSFVAEFDLARQGGENYRVSSTTYAIPCGEIFLQISMSEAIPAKHGAIFGQFISSFRFTEAKQSKSSN